MAYYSTRFKVNNSKEVNFKRKWKGAKPVSPKKKKRKIIWQRFKKVFYFISGFLTIILIIASLYAFGYLQSITEQLPSPDKPFGKKNAASEIYDRNGKLLYRVYGNENRDPVVLKDVPILLRYSVMAAEDINFYSHSGIDLAGLLRCGVLNLTKKSACGGSTITQQLIKQTALTNERSWERKIKEILLALQIEKQRSKSEILEMYLNVIPEGSNIYGIKSAASEYFGKDLDKLNLAEMAILASIPQDPNNLSPTRSANAESKTKVKERQMYVLDQMEKYMDKINEAIKSETGKEEGLLTKEMIDEARNYELIYTTAKKRDELKAPHFVFYVQKLLQERGYNNGEPFTKTNLETDGYKIYTTLDLDYQQIAEEQVKEAVDVYGKKYGAKNAALISLAPKTGEIWAMVGSYDYFGESYPAGCYAQNCEYAPEVNVLDTLQSYGSSMKPMVYDFAIEKGLISAGSLLPDIPIKIGNYKPKNFGNVFTGIRPARKQLTDSQNIPPIYMIDQLGVDNFVKEMQRWGYTTLTDPRGYGPSIAVGGADVKIVEHAQAYGILANQGKLVLHEVVKKIVDREGNVIFEYIPKEEQIADPRATFIVSDILNGNRGGAGLNKCNGGSDYKGWDCRDIAGKTGTSEDGKETLYATYTPELVTIGWLGNNNNKPMSTTVSGFASARPWIAEFMLRVGGTFPGTPFNRPAGVVNKGICDASEGSSCDGMNGDLGLNDINPPASVTVKSYTVCVDQLDHLARKIDIDLGKATTIQVKSYIMPDTKLQSYLDAYVGSKGDLGGIVPKDSCTINRSPSGTAEPWAVINSSGNADSGTIDIGFNAYTSNEGAVIVKSEIFIDSTLLVSTTSLPYSNNSLAVGDLSAGAHSLNVKVFDSLGNVGVSSISIQIKAKDTPTPTPTNSPVPIASPTPTNSPTPSATPVVVPT
jgi:penicillin-binding protein 1A